MENLGVLRFKSSYAFWTPPPPPSSSLPPSPPPPPYHPHPHPTPVVYVDMWTLVLLVKLGMRANEAILNSIMYQFHLFNFIDDNCIAVHFLVFLSSIMMINRLAPDRYSSNSKSVIYECMLRVKCMSTSCEMAVRWMSLNTSDDKSIFIHVMACCRQTTSHYMSQYWLSSMSLYSVTGAQWFNNWVNSVELDHNHRQENYVNGWK